MLHGAADEDDAGEPPGAVQLADIFPPPQSSQQVTVTVSPGLKSARCRSSEVVSFQFSATVPTWMSFFELMQFSIALPSVLLM